MAFIAFLTFGLQSAACPPQPITLKGGQVVPGFLIVKGWAYQLTRWNGQPPTGHSKEKLNHIFPRVNDTSTDATFLFPEKISACDGVYIPLQGDQPNYFPCQLFDPNDTVPPEPSTYTNTTACHTNDAAKKMLEAFTYDGVPTNTGTVKKAPVFFKYEDVNSTTSLMLYNGHVLNLKLLQSLPRDYFKVPENGLIDRMLKQPDMFVGKDMTYAIDAHREQGVNWKKEVECLSETIRVGQIDTMSSGCMFSEIILYVSLIVILGIIFAKFFLATLFGWCLSWKLGTFKEEKSYAARRAREEQIENWTDNMHNNGPVMKAPAPPSSHKKHFKRKTFLPTNSRFTPVEHGATKFDFAERSPLPAWKYNNNNNNNTNSTGGSIVRPDSMASFSPSFINNSPNHRASTTSFGSNFLTPGVSSFSWDGRSSDSLSLHPHNHHHHHAQGPNGNGPACPYPLSPFVVPKPPADYMPFNYPLAYTMCLVTCYSEGEDGIRCTLDSIATSDYPKSHTLMLVICDGLITGSGESQSTPDICVGMMRDFIVPPEQVEPQPYIAIGDGAKGNNRAKVYAGFYKYDDNTVPPEQQARVPMITVVKCGMPEETDAPKPGNRGKRDSQIVLMQFLQHVMFDERMTRFEYEFFNAIWRVTGVPADNFEICLMVDADTKLFPDALSRLISAAVKDPDISGLCGETRIANKKDSWVTMIQVFEYYISHHQSKAFESIFGGVTCLPGCFCMYRIKAPKGPNGYWVPILANPDIVQHYSENVVDTLHRKNLLLLGEDRYLTTLMLRTFPNRKMMFIPQAVCKTVVPDSFKVLLSQRRRWINSTIHNLFELVLVNDLCGTFCFSMQFFVFIELIGTLALPAAITFTLYVIIISIIGPPATMPLILLALILGLPALLIGITSKRWVYIGWMLIYLCSLPIWNFVLPAYAYWHFDDFSWGDTRKVEGVKKDTGHGGEGGQFDSSIFTMKKWSEYEMERRTKYAKEHKLPIPRFVEHNRSVDVFRETEYDDPMNRRYSDISNGSAKIPLTQQMDYTNARYRSEAPSSSTPLGIVPGRGVQLSDPPAPIHLNNNSNSNNNNNPYNFDEMYSTDRNSHVPPHAEGQWIQQSAHDNNWADPAPHHANAAFEEADYQNYPR
ncbi:chitin synthase-domain-containing protein [Mycotypha africana]|uniref:chitin synthase-domain-containing protein n=1 Tax=Mycotypha africana TaxID=64632 RepID=UPI0023018155|nr:chitin synthase-domain-containing protein [Mycotypha africana]KAI8984616.1 chitin synthase-domain-containing protein [Mycotypha africana]